MPISLLSTLALAGVLRDALPRFGTEVAPSLAPTNLLLDRVRGGERGDAVILTEAGIETLTAEGVLQPGTRQDLAISVVGIAVRHGAARPEIGTPDAFRRALLAAKSISYSRQGASGIFFAGLIERMGIAAEVNRKATIIPSGFTAELAARGEVELAVQQVSELLAVPGIDLVGPLPDALQCTTIFSAALFAGAPATDEAAALLRFLADPAQAGLYAERGLRAAG